MPVSKALFTLNVCVYICIKLQEWVLGQQMMAFILNVCLWRKDQRKTQTQIYVNKALTDTGPTLNSSKKLELSKVSNNSHIPSSQIQLNYPRQTLRRESLQFNTNMMHNTMCFYFGNKQTFKMTFLMKIWWRLNARRPQCNNSMWWHVQAHGHMCFRNPTSRRRYTWQLNTTLQQSCKKNQKNNPV